MLSKSNEYVTQIKGISCGYPLGKEKLGIVILLFIFSHTIHTLEFENGINTMMEQYKFWKSNYPLGKIKLYTCDMNSL